MAFLDYIQDLDRHISLAINSVHAPWSDAIWMTFSDKEIWYPLYALVAAALIWRLGWKKGIIAVVSTILVIVACDQGGNFVKDTVARYRPCWDTWMTGHGLHQLEGRYSYFGFYSAHAANSIGFAVCTALCFAWKKPQSRKENSIRIAYTIIIIWWALMVGISRVFLGRHFLGDVLAGFVAGTAFAFLFAYLGKALARAINS